MQAAVDLRTTVGLAIVEGDADAARELASAGGLSPFLSEIVTAAVDLADTGREITPRAILDAAGDSPTFDHVQWAQLTTAGTQALDRWTAKAAVKAYLDHRRKSEIRDKLKLALETVEAGGDPREILSSIDTEPTTAPAGALESLNIVRADEIPESAEIPDEVVEGLIVAGTTNILYGRTNTGKTAVAVSMAGAVATDRDFWERATDGGVVLYLAAEAPATILNRFRLWSRHTGARLDRVFIVRAPVNLTDDKDLNHIRQAVAYIEKNAGPIRFVVGDTLARIASGARENTDEMGPVMNRFDAIAEATGGAVLVIHHSGKDAAKGARGWSGVQAHISTELEVTEENGHHYLTVTKQRELGGKGEAIPFRLEVLPIGTSKFGKPMTGIVAVHEPDAPKKNADHRLGKNQRLALAHLTDLWREARENVTASGRDPSEAAVTAETWEERAKGKSRKADGEHVPFPRWSEVVQSLTDAELIRFDGPIVHILTGDSPSGRSGPKVRPGVFTDTPDRTDRQPESGEVRNSPIRTKSDQTDHRDPETTDDDHMTPEQRKWWDDHRDDVF